MYEEKSTVPENLESWKKSLDCWDIWFWKDVNWLSDKQDCFCRHILAAIHCCLAVTMQYYRLSSPPPHQSLLATYHHQCFINNNFVRNPLIKNSFYGKKMFHWLPPYSSPTSCLTGISRNEITKGSKTPHTLLIQNYLTARRFTH